MDDKAGWPKFLPDPGSSPQKPKSSDPVNVERTDPSHRESGTVESGWRKSGSATAWVVASWGRKGKIVGPEGTAVNNLKGEARKKITVHFQFFFGGRHIIASMTKLSNGQQNI